jgi:nucleoid-associated protein YgaU
MIVNKAKLASAVLGIGLGGGLEKLTISYESGRAGFYTDSIEALFNPNELGYEREVTWEGKRQASQGATSAYMRQQFVSSEPETLSITLFFDTYEARPDKLSLGHLKAALLPTMPLIATPDATNVREHTDKLALLAQVDQELHRPPRCKLIWGRFEVFKGVLTSLNQQFTMFMSDGMPVRATVTCSFIESFSESYAMKRRELHSADVAKTRVVRRNETLQSIAAEEYDDPTLWRHIARANRIANPRSLTPGTVLQIPRLRP